MDLHIATKSGKAINGQSRVQQVLNCLQTKYATLLLVLILGSVGYWLAPADLLPGQYTAHIQVVLADQTITAEYPFRLGQQTGDLVRTTTAQGAYQLTIEGQDSFAYALGGRITYRLQLLAENGRIQSLTPDQVTSTLYSLAYEQRLPATQQEDGWLVFSMQVPYKAKITTGLLFAVATLWLTEVIPLAAAAFLIPIVVVATGITDATTALQPFAHPIIVLFLAGFLLAEGLRRTGTDRLIALYILHHASLKPAYLMLTMMSITAFLSMWMSNTASVAILIPIALAVLEKIPDEAGQTGFRRALILGVAYAGAIGGIGSAIGTPANILAMTFLSEFNGVEMAFIDWFAYGLPVVILMVPIIWLYLLFAFRVRLRGLDAAFSPDIYKQELSNLGQMKRPQKIILFLFLTIIILWLTEQWHHLPTAIVALAGAFILFFGGIIQETDLKQINWNALLTFGGGLAIGTMLVTTGVSDWIALQLTGLATFPPLLVILLVAGLTLMAGAFISNTACAAMLIPLAIPLARILGIDPRLLVAVVAIASSIDFALVIGTPPTMMAYATGFFTTKEIFKRGIVLDLIGLLLLSLGIIWIWQWLGVVTLW